MRVKLTVIIEDDNQPIGVLTKTCEADSIAVASAIDDCLAVVEAATGGDVDRTFTVHELAEMHDFLYADPDEEEIQ